jgi:hypothetical protein
VNDRLRADSHGEYITASTRRVSKSRARVKVLLHDLLSDEPIAGANAFGNGLGHDFDVAIH